MKMGDCSTAVVDSYELAWFQWKCATAAAVWPPSGVATASGFGQKLTLRMSLVKSRISTSISMSIPLRSAQIFSFSRLCFPGIFSRQPSPERQLLRVDHSRAHEPSYLALILISFKRLTLTGRLDLLPYGCIVVEVPDTGRMPARRPSREMTSPSRTPLLHVRHSPRLAIGVSTL